MHAKDPFITEIVDGPWGKHGEVFKSEPLPNGEFLTLVRGVKERKDKT